MLMVHEDGRLWLKWEVAGGLSRLCSRTLDLRQWENMEGFKTEHWHARYLFLED